MGQPNYQVILKAHGKLPRGLHVNNEFDDYRERIAIENKALKDENDRYKAEIERLNKLVASQEDKKQFCDQCDSKGVKHKKECPTLPKE